jgi:predicted secreted protein with PEFG-CTERM motif
MIKVYDFETSDMTGRSAVMKIFNPDGKLYLSQPYLLGGEINFTITGPLAIPGYYEITLYYDNQTHVGTTILYDKDHLNSTRYYTYITTSGNTDIPIKYKAGSHILLDFVVFNHTANTMYVRAHAFNWGSSSDRNITVELPRNIINSVSNGIEQPFMITLGTFWLNSINDFHTYNNFTEISVYNNIRTLQIESPTDNPETYFTIGIQGTQSIPEFGPASMIVLLVAVTAIVAVTITSRQGKLYC